MQIATNSPMLKSRTRVGRPTIFFNWFTNRWAAFNTLSWCPLTLEPLVTYIVVPHFPDPARFFVFRSCIFWSCIFSAQQICYLKSSSYKVVQWRYCATATKQDKKDGYRQQNVRQRQKLISRPIIDYDVGRPYDFLLVRHCNYRSIMYYLRVIWRWIISWPW